MNTATLAAAPTARGARFEALLQTYATQITAALSLVVAVTGVMMFFHLKKGEVAEMHEWLGLGFVAAFGLHAFRHRRSLVRMLTQTRTRVILALAAALAIAFLAAGPEAHGGNPVHRVADAVLHVPLEAAAPALGVSPQEALDRLVAAGVANASTSHSLSSIGQINHVEPLRLVGIVLDGPPIRP